MKGLIKVLCMVVVFVLAANLSSECKEKKNLTIWSYSDEMQRIMAQYYKPARHGVNPRYITMPAEEMSIKLDKALAGGKESPDIFLIDETSLRKHVESGKLMDLSDIAKEVRGKQLAYPLEMATYNGKVYALCFQATPGALFYRRSLAKKYLGTDDPEKIQAMVSDFEGFMKTAALLHGKSEGTCIMTASFEDIFHACKGKRTAPWITEEKITIDEAMTEYMDMAKTMTKKGYTTTLQMWSPGWFRGMQDKMKDNRGRHVDVFCYLFPLWGLHYVIIANSPDTSGDWGVVRGPAAYNWGGNWVGAWKDSQNREQVQEFMTFLVSDTAFASGWAKETGAFVPNLSALNKSKAVYSNEYVGGQNYYAVFLENAGLINGKLLQSSDKEIDLLFSTMVRMYVEGILDKDEFLKEFRSRVSNNPGL